MIFFLGWKRRAAVVAIALFPTLISLNLSCTRLPEVLSETEATIPQLAPQLANGRPRLQPLPTPQEVWQCEVVVIGGSLGGVAAAAQAMRTGATTCLIELTPWLGGQISSQGVSALDESLAMRDKQNFSQSWQAFKQTIAQQPIDLPGWQALPLGATVAETNACWVGHLCFPPQAGAMAAQQWLQRAAEQAPQSRWQTSTAFKGAEFDPTGRRITAIYAVHRQPKLINYVPQGRLSQELTTWYAWSADETFAKVPMRLEPPAGKSMIVIDATDTGELIGWANLPHRLGSEARATTDELNAAPADNPDCTQAFTYPFAIALQSVPLAPVLQTLQPAYPASEHLRAFEMEGFPFFQGRSFFHYRRLLSITQNDPFTGTPVLGDITLVNWNRGNDWSWMNPPLILTAEQLEQQGQLQNWLGGISPIALGHAEDHALLFARWLLATQAQPQFPLAYLDGASAPMGTASGLSMVPYIREGRRILGRSAYGQTAFMMREADLRTDLVGGRDFNATATALTHYDIDIHGCRYRNGEPSKEASSAPAREYVVRPVLIPLEALIPQGVDNVLVGGKAIAVTHIVNALTRIHYSEWSIGAAAGTTAGWLTQAHRQSSALPISPDQIVPQGQMPTLQAYLQSQGLRLDW